MKLIRKQLKLLPVIPLLLSFNLNAQGIEAMMSSNINESFLSSLPPDLRGDLLDGQNLEDPAIDAVDPKTRVTNLEASLKDAERTLAQIKPNTEVTIVALKNSSFELLDYLNKKNIKLGDSIQIISIEPFDKSCSILLNETTKMTMTQQVCNCLMVVE